MGPLAIITGRVETPPAYGTNDLAGDADHLRGALVVRNRFRVGELTEGSCTEDSAREMSTVP
jgi:hypothetical protein